MSRFGWFALTKRTCEWLSAECPTERCCMSLEFSRSTQDAAWETPRWKLSGAVEPTAEMRAQRRGSRCFEVEVQGSKTNWGKKTAQLLQGISVSWTNFHVRGPAKSEPNSLQLSFFPVLKLLKKHIHFSFHDSKATFLKASWFQTQSDTAKCWVAVKNWWTWTLGKLGKVNRLVNMKTKEDMCTAMYELNQQKNHSRVQWSHLEPKNSTHGMHSWHQKLVRIVRASRSFKLWGTYALVRMGREISWLCEIPRRGGCQLLLLFWKKCFVRLSLFKF